MKHTLLLISFFFLCLSAASAQTSFSDRLSIKKAGEPEKVNLQIFPNPATDYIGITENKVVQHVTVFNLVGRQMKSFDFINEEKYYVGDLPRGMYLIQLLGSNGEIITTQRVNKR